MKSHSTLRLLCHLIFLAALAMACLAALKYAQTPFGWIGLAGFAFCIQLCVLVRVPTLRSIALTAAFFFLPLALAEFFLAAKAPPSAKTEFTPEGAMYDPSEILGYRPRANTDIHAVRTLDNTLVYDARYGINKHALRISPASSNNPNAPCLLMFGGSFTFAEGLQDEQTLPNQLALQSGGKYRVFNFGFPGYGPHQMLAAIELGMVEKITAQCERVFAIYTGIAQHVGRASGKAVWDVDGPRYVLDDSGSAKYAGGFDDTGLPYGTRIRRELNNSRLLGIYYGRQLYGPYDESQIKLYAAILAGADKALKHLFGDKTRLQTLMWHSDFFGEDEQAFNTIIEALKAAKLSPLIIDSQVLPPAANSEQYKLSPNDSHPSALAYKAVAQYALDELQLR